MASADRLWPAAHRQVATVAGHPAVLLGVPALGLVVAPFCGSPYVSLTGSGGGSTDARPGACNVPPSCDAPSTGDPGGAARVDKTL